MNEYLTEEFYNPTTLEKCLVAMVIFCSILFVATLIGSFIFLM